MDVPGQQTRQSVSEALRRGAICVRLSQWIVLGKIAFLFFMQKQHCPFENPSIFKQKSEKILPNAKKLHKSKGCKIRRQQPEKHNALVVALWPKSDNAESRLHCNFKQRVWKRLVAEAWVQRPLASAKVLCYSKLHILSARTQPGVTAVRVIHIGLNRNLHTSTKLQICSGSPMQTDLHKQKKNLDNFKESGGKTGLELSGEHCVSRRGSRI